MGNCFTKNNKFLKEQMKDEFYNRKVNMSIIGNYKPHQVFIGHEIKINETILGLNSLCNCDIHISIGTNPTRLILSYVDITENNIYKKGQTFNNEPFSIRLKYLNYVLQSEKRQDLIKQNFIYFGLRYSDGVAMLAV